VVFSGGTVLITLAFARMGRLVLTSRSLERAFRSMALAQAALIEEAATLAGHLVPGRFRAPRVRKEELPNARHLVLSVMYLESRKRSAYKHTGFLIGSGLLAVLLGHVLGGSLLPALGIPPLLAALAIWIGLLLIERRIRVGLFGTTAEEAKALLVYVQEKSDSGDLLGGDGHPIRAMLAEPLPEPGRLRGGAAQGAEV